MISTSKNLPLFGIGGIGFISVLIILFLKPAYTTFHFEDNWWALKTEKKHLIVSQDEAVSLAQSRLFPWNVSPDDPYLVKEIKPATSLQLSDTIKVHRLNQALLKIGTKGGDWLFFNSDFTSFPTDSLVSSEADFWVLSPAAKLPTSLKPPKKAIVYLGSRMPKKAVKDLAQKSGTPIISLHHNDEIKIRYKANQWQIQTASYDSKNN